MKKSLIYVIGAALLVTAASFPLYAQDEDVIYGRQLMTEQEIQEHRNQIRGFQTEQEREQYRLEHHQRMQERARTQGVTLPDEPAPRGKGMGQGQGQGQGQGMGPGKGQGKGYGQNQGQGKSQGQGKGYGSGN